MFSNWHLVEDKSAAVMGAPALGNVVGCASVMIANGVHLLHNQKQKPSSFCSWLVRNVGSPGVIIYRCARDAMTLDWVCRNVMVVCQNQMQHRFGKGTGGGLHSECGRLQTHAISIV